MSSLCSCAPVCLAIAQIFDNPLRIPLPPPPWMLHLWEKEGGYAMLANWKKLDEEVSCINNRLGMWRREGAVQQVCFLPLSLVQPCFSSLCTGMRNRDRDREGKTSEDKQRQCETGSGSGLLQHLLFVLLGRVELESQTPPPLPINRNALTH